MNARPPSAARPTLVRAEGIHVWDREGRRHLDATSGAFCAQLGYSRPDLVRAMTEAAKRLPHARPSRFQSEESVEYERALLQAVGAPYARVVLTSSGSEAVDVALKAAHVYQRAVGGAGRGFRYLAGHYHGATLGALGVTGWKARRDPYEGLLGDAGAGAGAAESVEEMWTGATPAAVILETIPAAGLGALVPPPGMLAHVRARCDEAGALWIADEVLTGFGRVGSLFAWGRLGEMAAGDGALDSAPLPDLIVFGKGAGAGYAALAGVILTERVANALDAAGFHHAQTYGGNPIACAVGRRVLEALRAEEIYERVRAMEGDFEAALRGALGDMPGIRDIRGLGFLWGIELEAVAGGAARPAGAAIAIAERCRERGLLVHATTAEGSGADLAGNVTGDAILLAPPLVAGPSDFEEIAAGLRDAIAALR